MCAQCWSDWSIGSSPLQILTKPVRHWSAAAPERIVEREPEPPRPVEDGRARALHSMARALWILTAFATVAALRLGQDVLVPLVLGVLLALVLSGIVESLRRVRIPRSLSAIMLLLIIGAGLGGILDAVWTPAQEWMENAPRVLRTIEHRMRPAQSIVQRIDAIADRVSALATPGAKPGAPSPAASSASTVSAVSVLAGTGWVAAATVMSMALTLLLLGAGPGTLARMTATLAHDWQSVQVLRIIHAIRLEVGRYYATLALINLGFGTVTALIMWALGMPNPVLWGAVAGVLNFIPYLGCATTFVILTLVGLVTFDRIGHTLLVCASFLLLAVIEGHVIEPIFIGRRLDLNPIVVLVALWVGGWIWGIPGVILAVPVLVATKVAAAHSTRGRAAVRFLGPNRRPQRVWEIASRYEARLPRSRP
jgi:predicted PurR-regulated permease PerM